MFHDLHSLYPGSHRQQDEWHHLPPLAFSKPTPGLTKLPDRNNRAGLCLDNPESAEKHWRNRERFRLPERNTPPVRHDNKEALTRSHHRPASHQGQPGCHCSTCRSSASTSTSASFSTSSRTIAFYNGSRPTRRGLRAARAHLRRQGGGELSSGQAHHQADPRCGATW